MAYGQGMFNFDQSVIRNTSYINKIILCSTAVIVFFICLVLITKCVYKTFRVKSDEERENDMRRKQGRSSRIFST